MNLNYIIFIGVVVIFLGCLYFAFNRSYQTDILKSNDEDWRDLEFSITSFEIKDNVAIIKTAGKYKGKTVGFGAEIPVKFRLSILDEDGGEIEKGSFFSLGCRSNRFINVLSEIYGCDCSKKMRKRISFDIIALDDCDLTDYASKKIRYMTKLFFDSGEEDGYYCEMFLNINSDTMKLEFCEKDTDYRESIMEAFTESECPS